jgi:hypothetical protein
MNRFVWCAVGVMCVVGCGPAELRIDGSKGIPEAKGGTTIDISTAGWTCGSPITSGTSTVTTTVVTGGCQFAFEQDVQVLKASDYAGIPEFQGATNLVQRVELEIRTLTFTDATTNTVLDAQTRVTSATLSINGQQVADKTALSNLPKTVTLQGDALTPLKAAIDARQAASVHAKCVAVMPDSPPPPAKLKIDYDVQPAIIVGPGKLF